MDPHLHTIYLGGGCFWCTEAVFQSLKGVREVVPGYMGGTVARPSYEAVSTGTTGHAEVVRVTFDDSVISLDDLLDIFFATHDPTTVDRQGADVGSQYRSIIFYTGDAMREAASEAMRRAQAALPEGKALVTHLAEAVEFYQAEPYHDDYYRKNATAPYCQLVIHPKLEKLQKRFSDKLAGRGE